jgi:arylsulfatase A-like enzyme/uncharacterized membrane protein YbhN (UPF0104 family)
MTTNERTAFIMPSASSGAAGTRKSFTAVKIVLIAIKVCFIGGIFVTLFNPELLRFVGVSADKFKGVTFSSLAEVFKNIDLGGAAFWLTFAAVVKMLGIFAGVMRWHLLLKGQGIRLPFWYLTKCWFMGRAIGLFLPGTVGLDGYRLVESAAYTGEAIKCTTVVAVEKLIGFVALALLVFLTLPLGMRLFDFNIPILAVLLVFLAVFISTAFLLLLNPRILQVVVAAVPTPGFIRHKVNKLGAAVTAYSEHRATLMGAVLLGLCVHLGICLMYFGTAMAVTGGTASLLDVLFASPLVIVFSIIAPTVSGVGVREGGFALLLGSAYGASEAVLAGHLGLWAGEMVPFLLSVPLLLFATRPDRAKFLNEMKAVRESGVSDEDPHLAPEVVREYRTKLINAALAGIFGGMIGGALVGLTEALWHVSHLSNVVETSALAWAPFVYGIVFSGMGLGIVAWVIFLYLLFNRFLSVGITFGLSLGGTLGVLALVFGRFRFQRDVMQEQALSMGQNLNILAAAAGIALVAALIGWAIVWGFQGKRWRGIAAGVGVWLLLVAAGASQMAGRTPRQIETLFSPESPGSGPNVILIAVDTLRADYLKVYNDAARPKTPNVTALANDSILFQKAFAQSSWTKASFGTIFSGMYPEAHTATGKVSALPDDVHTIAETLEGAGYFTQGFSNNPNISGVFNYNQGFSNYTDLKPDLYFGANRSSEKLVLYDILRKVIQKVYAKTGGWINITDFYQPADVVTKHGLDWVDRYKNISEAPFCLFLHYMDPHDPFRDPERPGKGYARVQMANPDPDKYKEAFIRSYSHEIEFMDTHVGRLLEGLRERGLYDDTLIVFTADHGEEFYEHGGWWHGLSLYDEQIAVPLIIKLPGNQYGGKTNPHLARHVDLAPTVAQVTGTTVSPLWQGRSLFNEAYGAGNEGTEKVYAHLNFEGILLRALRTQTYKQIHANEGNKREYAPVELYDLIADPGEQVNLVGQPDLADILESYGLTIEEMRAFVEENAAEPTISVEGAEDLQEQLEDLGYLGD